MTPTELQAAIQALPLPEPDGNWAGDQWWTEHSVRELLHAAAEKVAEVVSAADWRNSKETGDKLDRAIASVAGTDFSALDPAHLGGGQPTAAPQVAQGAAPAEGMGTKDQLGDSSRVAGDIGAPDKERA